MKLLVVKLSDIGDVLTAVPALRALRQTFSQAHISILVPLNSAEILDGSPLADNVLVFDKFRFDRLGQVFKPINLAYGVGLFHRLRSEGFDMVVILHHLTTLWGVAKYATLALATGAERRVGLDNGRGWFLTDKTQDYGFGHKHEVEYWLEVVRLLGAKAEDTRLEVPVLPEDEAFVNQALAGAIRSTLVAIHLGSGKYSRARRWPVEDFVKVARNLVDEDDAQIVLVGGREEAELGRVFGDLVKLPLINLVGKTTLRQLAAVLKRCQLFVGNDSGVMHVAAAMGIPVVAIFGPSNPRAWGPWCGEVQERATVVRADIVCSPCLYIGRALGSLHGCDDLACIKLVTPAMVLEAARKALAGNEKPDQHLGRGS